MRVDRAKQELVRKRKVEARESFKAANVKMKREIKCFWTWPFGHAYKWSNAAQAQHCVGCDKKMVL